MMKLTAKEMRTAPGLPEEANELFDFLERIKATLASADGENWTVDWEYDGMAHMDCRGGSLEEVWKRFMRDLAAYRVNGRPIIVFGANLN